MKYLKLLKALTRKNNFSILNKLWVKDRILHCSNMDVYLQINNIDLPDGIYEVKQYERFVKKGIIPIQTFGTMDDVPEVPIYDYGNSIFHFTIPEYLWYYVGKNARAYILTGVFIENNKLVALNGRCMIMEDTKYEVKESFIFPSILQNIDIIDYTLYCSKDHFQLVSDNITITGNCLLGKFPKYSLYIPEKIQYEFSLDVSQLHWILQNIECEMEKDSSLIICKLEKNKMYFTTPCVENKKSTFEIIIENNDNDMITGHNYHNLMLLTKTFTKGILHFKHNGNLSQIMVNDNVIIMPIKMNDVSYDFDNPIEVEDYGLF